MRKFSKENLTVKVSGAIVDAHLIPMKFRTEGRQPLKIFYNAVALNRVKKIENNSYLFYGKK